jgi:hypothetical protein
MIFYGPNNWISYQYVMYLWYQYEEKPEVVWMSYSATTIHDTVTFFCAPLLSDPS